MAERHERPARVLVADRIDQDAEAWLAERFEVVRPRSATPDGLIEAVRDCEALVVRTTRVGSDLIESARRLRVIAKYGTGTDNIDVEAATRMGIVVTNCPGANAPSVAEFALTLILLMLRPVIAGAEWLRSGAPAGSLVVATEQAGLIGSELSSQTVGVIGWGDIGRRVGMACMALGARVIAHDPGRPRADIESDGAGVTETLDELLGQSDVVTVHVPLTFATAGLIGSAQLARMRPHAALVNVSRGGVVDEAALAAALSTGKLRCAATDVFSQEPPPPDHQLVALPNALCTPHMAGTTADAFLRTGRSVATAVDDVLSGRLPQDIVNREVTEMSQLADPVNT